MPLVLFFLSFFIDAPELGTEQNITILSSSTCILATVTLLSTAVRLKRIHKNIRDKKKKHAGLHSSQAHSNLPRASKDDTRTLEPGPGMILFPSCPAEEEWTSMIAANKTGFALTGSAAMGQVGPTIGLIDIGESEDAYFFRASLPGVKRDEKEFSCQVENDGRVVIKGVTTTGEKTVHRFSQVFEMQSMNLCPPGEFSITFQLPGPVDPEQFFGDFGMDGILEGIVTKGWHPLE